MCILQIELCYCILPKKYFEAPSDITLVYYSTVAPIALPYCMLALHCTDGQVSGPPPLMQPSVYKHLETTQPTTITTRDKSAQCSTTTLPCKLKTIHVMWFEALHNVEKARNIQLAYFRKKGYRGVINIHLVL